MHRMNEQERLERALRAWKKQTADVEPPPAIERAVVQHLARTPKHRWPFYVLGGAAAAAIGLALMPGSPAPAPQPEQGFIAIPYVIQPASYERVEIVRAEVSAAELIAVGFPVSGDPAARLEADLLVGQDGRARAVRLIPEEESE